MKAKFDFSCPCPCAVVCQVISKDSRHWRKEHVCFVIDTNDAETIEAALTAEVESHKDWTLTKTRKNERLLTFNGGGVFKKLYAIETTNFCIK